MNKPQLRLPFDEFSTAVPVTAVWRPIHYLGSKLRLVEPIRSDRPARSFRRGCLRPLRGLWNDRGRARTVPYSPSISRNIRESCVQRFCALERFHAGLSASWLSTARRAIPRQARLKFRLSACPWICGRSKSRHENRAARTFSPDAMFRKALTGNSHPINPGTRQLEHVPKKLTDFFDQNMLQVVALERILIDRVLPPDRNTLERTAAAGSSASADIGGTGLRPSHPALALAMAAYIAGISGRPWTSSRWMPPGKMFSR